MAHHPLLCAIIWSLKPSLISTLGKTLDSRKEALFNGSLASVEVRGTMTSDSGVECMYSRAVTSAR